MSHPWRTLRSLPTEIIWTSDPELLGGRKAAWYPALDVITMSPHLTQVERRCSLAHELGHRHAADHPTGRDDYDATQEAAADQWAARFLIPLDALADALRWATCPDEAADELWVTRHTLDVRLATLDTTEKIFLDQLLHHTAI